MAACLLFLVRGCPGRDKTLSPMNVPLPAAMPVKPRPKAVAMKPTVPKAPLQAKVAELPPPEPVKVEPEEPPEEEPVDAAKPAPEAPVRARPATNPCRVRAVDLQTATSMHRMRTAIFVDTRPASEFMAGHIPGAFNISADDFDNMYRKALPSISKSAQFILYSSGEALGEENEVCDRLFKKGYWALMYMEVGWKAWQEAHLPVE